MKRILLALFLVVCLSGACPAGERPELKDRKSRDSYSLGYRYGEGVKNQGTEIDPEVFAAGLRDALGGAQPLMSKEEIQATVDDLQKRVFSARQQMLRERAARNLEEGKAFLAANAKREGVTTLPSGLQYEVLAAGAGASPKAGDSVAVHYRGAFTDGTEFDSSYARGSPETVQVDAVIAGWTEALQRMKEGDKWRLFVPADLAYGERGMGRIPPNSALIFEVELIKVD
jgi:FKBP-type peptidyl-prolyl cis-trans isomerase FklB